MAPNYFAGIDPESWLSSSSSFAVKVMPDLILANGAVRAAQDERYGFSWKRDQAIVMWSLYSEKGEAAWDQMRTYREYSRFTQQEVTDASKANGEAYNDFQAKDNLDGTSVPNWMAQGDGPALRAVNFMRWGYDLIRKGADQNRSDLIQEVNNTLFDSAIGIASRSVIKYDLESLSLKNNYGMEMAIATNGEPWEEDWGRHLWNKSVSRTALLMGSVFARNFHLSTNPVQAHVNNADADRYLALAQKAKVELEKHWDSQNQILRVTLAKDPQLGEDPSSRAYKNSGLDAQVIMSAVEVSRSYLTFSDLLASSPSLAIDRARFLALANEFSYMSATDSRMQSTFSIIEARFAQEYPVNTNMQNDSSIAPAWGRYPEDQYSGDGSVYPGGGNPWILTTQNAGMFQAFGGIEYMKNKLIIIDEINSQYFAKLSESLAQKVHAGMSIRFGDPLFKEIITAQHDRAIAYAKRIERHSNPDYSMSEQLSRNTGYMTSVQNLEWNYANQPEFLKAILKLEAMMNASVW